MIYKLSRVNKKIYHNHFRGFTRLIAALPLVVILSCCVSVPKEAVLLSEAVGQRIVAIQTAHEALVLDYFQRSRNTIDQFIQEKYTPQFMSNFVSQSGLMGLLIDPTVLSDQQELRLRDELLQRGSFSESELDQILLAVNSGTGDAERGQIIIEFATAAQEQINAQRTEMIAKVDQAERTLLKELRSNYAELFQIQSEVTAHIRSAHKVVDAQDNLLRRLNLMEKRDQIIDQAVDFNERITSVVESSQEVGALIEQFKETSLKDPEN